jgi:hypothetical protein
MRNLVCHAPLVVPREASGTAQFSRQYNSSCNTCHTAFPRLNDVGTAFKDDGFQFSEEDFTFIATPRTLLTTPAVIPHSTKMSLHRPEWCAWPAPG